MTEIIKGQCVAVVEKEVHNLALGYFSIYKSD